MSKKQQNTHNPAQLLEDMGQVVAALIGTLLSSRGQLRERAQQQTDLLLQRLPFVTRSDYDALHGMLQKARLEQEALKARLEALEGKKASAPSGNQQRNMVNEKLTKPATAVKKSKAATKHPASRRS